MGLTNRYRRGFTLVELLVVVSIIALLVSILIPSLAGARRQARRVKCGTNLRQIGIAMQLYLVDNNDFFPSAPMLPSLPPAPNEGERPGIATVLKPYLNDNLEHQDDVFRCPADWPDKNRREFPNKGKSYYETEGTSYAFNFFLSGTKMFEFVRKERVRDYFKGNVAEEEIWVMRDYIGFHGEAGQPLAANYLYIDGRVGDLAR